MAQPGRDSVTLPNDTTLTGKNVDSWSYSYYDWNPGNSGVGALVTRWTQAATLVDGLGNVLQEWARTGDSALQVKDPDILMALSDIGHKLDILIEIMAG